MKQTLFSSTVGSGWIRDDKTNPKSNIELYSSSSLDSTPKNTVHKVAIR